MSAVDSMRQAAADYADRFPTGLAPRPATAVAVLTCMDCRVDPAALLGLGEGDAHVLRNAGGVVTDDVLRSLAMSQRLLGTRSVVVIQHTSCGMAGLDDEAFREEVAADAGQRPTWATPDFSAEPSVSVGRAVTLLKESDFLPHRDDVLGFVFDVNTGELRQVEA